MERLEYIESNGAQNLILDFIPTSKTRLQVGIMPTCVSGSAFINTVDWTGEYGQFRLFNYNSKFYYDYGTSRVANGASTFYKYQYYDIEMGNKYIKSNGSSIASASAVTYNFTTSLRVFCKDNVRFYYIKIYDIGESGEEELLRSYIPVLDDDNIPCLYEEINNLYYYQDDIEAEEKELFIFGKYSKYNTVQDAIDASVDNMVQIIENGTIPMGSGVCFFPGADWLTINNKVCKYLYVNTHSYFGFNENKKELSIFNSDYIYFKNIWREIGTIEEYKFIKVRYEGYPIAQEEANRILYDVYLFETGDIFINLASTKCIYATLDNSSLVTTSNTYNLKIAKNEPYVSLYKISELNDYSVEKSIINFHPITSVIEKMLLGTDEGYYTIKDGEFIFLSQDVVDHWDDIKIEPEPTEEENEDGETEITIPAIINANLFKKCGFLDIPTQSQLIEFYNIINEDSETLKNFKLLGWWEDAIAAASLDININALPKPQSVTSQTVKIPYTKKVNYYTAVGIEGVTIECEGDILFQVSFRNKTDTQFNWKYWNGTEWLAADTTEIVGMTATEMQAITSDQWYLLFNGSYYITMKMIFTEKNQKINSLVMTFLKEKVTNSD